MTWCVSLLRILAQYTIYKTTARWVVGTSESPPKRITLIINFRRKMKRIACIHGSDRLCVGALHTHRILTARINLAHFEYALTGEYK